MTRLRYLAPLCLALSALPAVAAETLVTVKSPHDARQTMDRLEKIVTDGDKRLSEEISRLA